MTGLLHVWLRGQHLGELERLRNGRLRLRYTETALDTWGIGARPLSLSLPLTDKRVQGDSLERFLDNLLPEGAVRGALEREHHIRPGDTFALLTRIGRECAGAIQFTSGDAAPGDGELVDLEAAQVDRVVADLPTLSPPDGQAVTTSLGGMQSKVLLTRTERGWAWPGDGAVSTATSSRRSRSTSSSATATRTRRTTPSASTRRRRSRWHRCTTSRPSTS